MFKRVIRRYRRNKVGLLAPLGVVVLVVAGGVYSQLRSHAQVPTATIEAEKATSSAEVCSGGDSSASGGQFLTFGCAAPVPAYRAADFLGSLGLNTHLSSPDYTTLSAKQLNDDLSYLGVSNIRDNSGSNAAVATRQALAAAGVTFDFTTLKPASSSPTAAQIQTAVNNRYNDIMNNNLAAATLSVENFNEYDNPSVNGNNSAWPTVISTAQHDLASVYQATAIKVLGPSLLGFNVGTTAPEVGDLSNYLQYGNIHSYPGGSQPDSLQSSRPTSFSQQSCTSGQTDDLDSRLNLYASCISKDQPLIVSESGYSDDPNTTTGQKYTDDSSIASYLTRLYLDNFRIGVSRTYIYELLDQPSITSQPSSEAHLGIFDGNNQVKPQAKAIHNLTTLLSDTGSRRSSFTPIDLRYSLTGNTATVHQLLLQKSDGSYWLALWLAKPIWDTSKFSAITVSPQLVSIRLASTATFTTYRPVDSSSQLTTVNQSGLDISLDGAPTLVKIVPGN